jgi:hypothetical protein
MTGVRGLDISSTSSASFSVTPRLLRVGFFFEASAGVDRAWGLDNLHAPKAIIEARPKSRILPRDPASRTPGRS